MLKLKEYRELKNITQKEAAKQLNIKQTTYCQYENGINEPNIETLINFANFYNCTVDELINNENNLLLNKNNQSIFNELNTLINSMNYYQKQEVLGFCKGLLQKQNNIENNNYYSKITK